MVTVIVALASGQAALGWWQLGATGVYLIGVIVVTGVIHVPLNVAIARDLDRAPFENALGAVQPRAVGRVDRSPSRSRSSRRFRRSRRAPGGRYSVPSDELGLGDGLGGSDGVTDGDGDGDAVSLTVHW